MRNNAKKPLLKRPMDIRDDLLKLQKQIYDVRAIMCLVTSTANDLGTFKIGSAASVVDAIGSVTTMAGVMLENIADEIELRFCKSLDELQDEISKDAAHEDR